MLELKIMMIKKIKFKKYRFNKGLRQLKYQKKRQMTIFHKLKKVKSMVLILMNTKMIKQEYYANLSEKLKEIKNDINLFVS